MASIDYDPYKFPPVEETVGKMLVKDKFPYILDTGDALNNRPGRKYKYTKQDFLESYLGKDYHRGTPLSSKDEGSMLFSFHESLKQRYPISSMRVATSFLE